MKLVSFMSYYDDISLIYVQEKELVYMHAYREILAFYGDSKQSEWVVSLCSVFKLGKLGNIRGIHM